MKNARTSFQVQGEVYMFGYSTDLMFVATGYDGNSTILGGDQKTFIVALGDGNVNVLLGNGTNSVYGAGGKDFYVGGNTFNSIASGSGDDIVIGGLGSNKLYGGEGKDIIVFRQGDIVAGGTEADRFVFAEKTVNWYSSVDGSQVLSHCFLKDFSYQDGDVLDLSLQSEIYQQNIFLIKGELVVYTAKGFVQFDGLASQIAQVGGINSALDLGIIKVNGYSEFPPTLLIHPSVGDDTLSSVSSLLTYPVQTIQSSVTFFEKRYDSFTGLHVEGEGFVSSNGNSAEVVVGFGADAVIFGANQDTTIVCVGDGRITAFLGDFTNYVMGGEGDDCFVGGSNYNRLFGGNGNDVLNGGGGVSYLNGEEGNDTILVKSYNIARGGPGADNFIFLPDAQMKPTEFVCIEDLSFKENDRLDFLAVPEITRFNMMMPDSNTLRCYTQQGYVDFQGVGTEISLVGGIDAAIEYGYISLFDGSKG